MFALAIVLSFTAASGAKQELRSVETFTVRRDQCDHFRGEEAYDKARGRFLAAQMRKYCKGTDRELKRLRVKYAKNRAVIERLAPYEDRIE